MLGRLLESDARPQIVHAASQTTTLGEALLRLRDGMRRHVWEAGDTWFDAERAVEKLDRKTRQIGFHALNDWDGIGDRVNDDIIPVDVLHYLIERRGSEPPSSITLAILLDYYVMHLLGLLTLRIWDEGDADANLDRVGALLHALQGPQGSGQVFTSDVETLLLLATSHYEMYERGYAVLLRQVRSLNAGHQLRIALGHAVSMGCHLRFGFEATYGRDTVNMRDDNVADYPWLLYALNTVLHHFVAGREHDPQAVAEVRLVEGLINGLSGDARAFVGRAPGSLQPFSEEREQFRCTFEAHRAELLSAFEHFRPAERRYSPLSFFFNFSHNVVKGYVIDALLEQRVWPVGFNDLLTASGDTEQSDVKERLARTLMDYARANPQTIRGRLKPVIVYDPSAGRQAFGVAMRKLREL